MPRQKAVGARDLLPESAFAPLVPPGTLSAALDSFAVWANSTSARQDLMEQGDFPLPGDVPAFLVLNQLVYRGAARPTDLATAVEVTTSHISKIIARLEDAGLVLRAPDPGDARAVIVGLTTQGKSVGERILASIAAGFEAIFADWDDHDRTELERLVVKLAHSVDATSARALSRASGYSWTHPDT